MTTKRSRKRARHLAVASTAGLALLAAVVASGGTATADTAPGAHHASTPAWKAALSGGDTGAESLLSVTSVDANHAWAAGRGTDGNGILMQWDGQSWTQVTDPGLPQVERWSAVSAVSADDVWAYGSLTTATGGTQYLVHYDGTQWTAVDAAGELDRSWPEAPIKAVAGRLFKGGDALYTYSDGTWQTFALPDGVDIQGIDALSADDAYATGMQFPVDGGHPVVYHWDGTTWTLMPQQPAAPAGVAISRIAAVAPNDVYVAGWGNTGPGQVTAHVEHWDGSSWHDITGGLTQFQLESLRSDGHGGLWAAGEDSTSVDAAPAFWHYDGTTWTNQPVATVPDAARPGYTFHDLAPVDGAGGSRFLAVGDYPAPTNSPDDPQTVRGLIEQTQSTLDLTTADLSVSSTATHTVRVHAESGGRLTITFHPAAGQPDWSQTAADLKVTSVGGAPQGACTTATGAVNTAAAAPAVTCDLPAGDDTLTYTLSAGPYVDAWQVTSDVRFDASDAGAASPEVTADFSVKSPYPVPTGTRFLGRDAQGVLWRYDGTGNAAAPYRARVSVGPGWQMYSTITKLSTLTVHGVGDLVGRDANGVLWYYRGGGDAKPFAPATKVGSGWNMFNSLVGAGDLDGDGRADLLAREPSGMLWLYQGTGNQAAPFAPRVKIGAGWQVYDTFLSTGDLTGDGRPDLLTRDASGVLWLYQGTGNAAAPFAPRVQVGTGWNIYYMMFLPGDVTGDGRADFFGRDGSGALWLYKGTGNAAAPYAARVKVGTGWSIYNSLI